MLKVIIVDDEEKVCRLIYHLVDWEELGMEVVKVIHDGLEALEYIINNEPEVVITDIRMPNCDGLEMIEKVREQGLTTNFIIISGYSNFEYAKNAIRYGVEDYLLKPLEKKEIVATLKSIRDKRTIIEERQAEELRLKDIVEVSKEKSRDSLLSDMIINKNSQNFSNIQEVNEEYQTHFVNGYFMTIIVQPFMEQHLISDEELSIMLPKIEQMIVNRLNDYGGEVIAKPVRDCVWCIVNSKDDMVEDLTKKLKKIRIDVLKLKSIFKGIEIHTSFGKQVMNITDLGESLSSAEQIMFERIIVPEEKIHRYSQEFCLSEDISTDLLLKDELFEAMEHLDLRKIKELTNLIKDRVKSEDIHGYKVYQIYCRIVDMFIHSVQKFRTDYRFPDRDFFIQYYTTYFTTDDVFDGVNEILGNVTKEYRDAKIAEEAKPIKEAKEYISRYFNTLLTLEEVSRQVGFNPAYLSSLFKKETGKNFLEYITETRINKAKQLLITANDPLADVAWAVGYSDIKYFSKIFKRIVGLAPSEYRKLYS
ncbi:MAG: response regulator [Suipraeoptans sp.]